MDTESTTQAAQIIAAIDLGSNSFHMVVSRFEEGHFKTIDRLREMVRLSAGISQYGEISADAADRAIECLQKFGQRLRDMHADSVRAVGTNALRMAKNPKQFLERAQQALGHPIEIISGIEEARLIYKGATYAVSDPSQKQLVLDIGGGSTEIIIGQAMLPLHMESLFMGCVSMSERYFADGNITRTNFDKARVNAMREIRTVAHYFKRKGWTSVLGASGTIKSVALVLMELDNTGKEITALGVKNLVDRLIDFGHVDKINLNGLKKERVPVFAGGVSILAALFESLEIESLTFSDGGLREGVLYDLLGRLNLEFEDVRSNAVQSMERRYHIEYDQASRVEVMALLLLQKVKRSWQLGDLESEHYLSWAARLHEIGLDLAHSQYHRHGGYILQHADMPGFAWNEQRVLAAIVACHRRKIRMEYLQEVPEQLQEKVIRLIVLIRLAVLLNRERTDRSPPLIRIETENKFIRLRFPSHWLQNHPLTLADLEEEASYLKAVDIALAFEDA